MSGRNAARVPVAAILAWLVAGIVLLAVSVAALLVMGRLGTPVTITVDGYSQSFRTTQPDVAGLLADQGLALRPEDRVSPAPETPLAADLAVTIVRARPGLVDADGRLHQVYTQAHTVGELIQSAGVRLGAHDEIWLDGAQVAFETALASPVRPEDLPRFARSHAWSGKDALPVRLHIVRAVPIVVDDGSVPYTLYTTAPTIGEALLREQVSLYLGDYVTPSLGSRVSSGLHVAIERSTPVLVTADGRTTHTRTRGKTVGGTLMDLGILVTDNDRVTPPLDQPVVEQQQIRLVRISHVTLVDRKPIPYESVLVPDDNLEIDTQRLAQAGRERRVPQAFQGHHGGRHRGLADAGGRMGRGGAGHAHGRLRPQDRAADAGDTRRASDLLAQDPHVFDLLFPGSLRHAQVCAVVWPHAHRPEAAQGYRGRGPEGDSAAKLGVRTELWQSDRR